MDALTSGPEDTEPLIEAPPALLIDLSIFGIEETEPGICADTYENRKKLRAAKFQWTPLYSKTGHVTDYLQVVTPDMQVATQERKKILLTDQKDLNADYITGVTLILESEAQYLVPSWVISATRHWNLVKDRREDGEPNYRPALASAPGRCAAIRSNGLRCANWHNGTTEVANMCKMHLTSRFAVQTNTLQRARNRLLSGADGAVEILETLMQTAESEPVRLNAARDYLDRAGLRQGIDINIEGTVEHKSASEVLAERLIKLNKGAENAARILEQAEKDRREREQLEAGNTIDAEIVEDEE